MKQEIEIPDLPKGWKVVSYRRPGARYYYLHNGKVFSDSNQVSEYLIVGKIKPRRIVLEEITTEDIDTNTKLYNILGSYWIEDE